MILTLSVKPELGEFKNQENGACYTFSPCKSQKYYAKVLWPVLFPTPSCIWITKNEKACWRIFLYIADVFLKAHGSTSVCAREYKTFCA